MRLNCSMCLCLTSMLPLQTLSVLVEVRLAMVEVVPGGQTEFLSHLSPCKSVVRLALCQCQSVKSVRSGFQIYRYILQSYILHLHLTEDEMCKHLLFIDLFCFDFHHYI